MQGKKKSATNLAVKQKTSLAVELFTPRKHLVKFRSEWREKKLWRKNKNHIAESKLAVFLAKIRST